MNAGDFAREMPLTTVQPTQTAPSRQTVAVLRAQFSNPSVVPLPCPSVVSTASTLNIFILVVLSIGMTVGLAGTLYKDQDAMNSCLPFAVLFAGFLWHGRNLGGRTQAGWITQAVLSMLGLWLFPIGSVINTVILYSWFKPEVKAWFHQN